MKKRILSSLLSLTLLASPSNAKCMINDTSNTVRSELVQKIGEDNVNSYNVLLNVTIQLSRLSNLCDISDLPNFQGNIQTVLNFIVENWNTFRPHLGRVILENTDQISEDGLYSGIFLLSPSTVGNRLPRCTTPFMPSSRSFTGSVTMDQSYSIDWENASIRTSFSTSSFLTSQDQ